MNRLRISKNFAFGALGLAVWACGGGDAGPSNESVASGGDAVSSGGANQGSTGGASTASGGTSAATGGTTTLGSGGDAMGSGGESMGSGGAPTGSGGESTTGAGGDGTGGSQGPGEDGYEFGNAPVPSAGCGKALGSLTTGGHTMTSADLARSYNLALPQDYDPETPYRVVFGMHFLGGSADVVRNDKWYGLQPKDTEGKTIWVAPQGYTDNSPWRGGDDKDHIYFDDLLALMKSELCIDESRVFSVGWSFGAMFTNSLAQTHQDVLRGVAVFSTADFNIYFPENTGKPLAYMGVHGIYDDLCPFDSGQRSKQRFVDNNGCTGPNPIPENTGGPAHVTTDFDGCGNFPVRWATFAGGHVWDAADNGQPTWTPGEVWEFISQF